MSRIVVGYIDGRPQYRDDGPARGRLDHRKRQIAGSFVVGHSEEDAKQAQMRMALDRLRNGR